MGNKPPRRCTNCDRPFVVLQLRDLAANTPEPDVVGFCSITCLRQFIDDRFPRVDKVKDPVPEIDIQRGMTKDGIPWVTVIR